MFSRINNGIRSLCSLQVIYPKKKNMIVHNRNIHKNQLMESIWKLSTYKGSLETHEKQNTRNYML